MIDLIEEHAGVAVHPSMPVAELERICDEVGVPHEPGMGPGQLVLELYEKTVEPNLVGPMFVCDYPREVSPLARTHRDDPALVERFEPVVLGRELGNAFSELNDPVDQHGAVRGPGEAGGRGRRGGARRRRGLRARAGVRASALRRPRHRHRPPGDAHRRGVVDP